MADAEHQRLIDQLHEAHERLEIARALDWLERSSGSRLALQEAEAAWEVADRALMESAKSQG